MTDNIIQLETSIATENDLKDAFSELLHAAEENNLDPVGTWDIENGHREPDWEVMVVNLVQDRD